MASRTAPALAALAAHPRWLLLAAGALLGAAFAPLFWWPLLVPAFGVLRWRLLAAPRWQTAALDGWVFGLGMFGASLWWLGASFRYAPSVYAWWLALPTVGGLCVYLALYPALATVLAWVLLRRVPARWHSVALPAVLGLTWVLAEVLRGTMIYGFPWNLIGYVFAGSALALQPAALGSVWLLSLLAVVGGTAAAHWPTARLYLPLVLLPWVWGGWRLHHAAPAEAVATVRLVQGNIPQTRKWAPDQLVPTINRQLELSTTPASGYPDLIVWSETALPIMPQQWPGLTDRLRAVLAERPGTAHSILVYGEPTKENGRYYNSMVALDPAGHSTSYAKHLLVPFGEFMPLKKYLPTSLEKMTHGENDFSPGTTAPALKLGHLTALPLICYEAIFPAYVRHHARGKDFMLNITNDGWFAGTPGPQQHFAMARTRTVETGLSLVRAANTGVTAVVDGYGRIVHRLKLRHTDRLDSFIPKHVSLSP